MKINSIFMASRGLTSARQLVNYSELVGWLKAGLQPTHSPGATATAAAAATTIATPVFTSSTTTVIGSECFRFCTTTVVYFSYVFLHFIQLVHRLR